MNYLPSPTLKEAVGKDVLNELDEKLALIGQNIVSCMHCKRKYGFEVGNIQEIVKDMQGKHLTGYLTDHMHIL